MPTIGAGKHGYPEDVVLNIIQEEVKRISSQHDGVQSLKDIAIIVFKENQRADNMSSLSGNTRRHTYSSANATPNTSLPPHNRIGTSDEIHLHCVGFKKDVDEAISWMKSALDKKKDEKHLKDIGNILQTHRSEVVKLSSNLLIECSASENVIIVKGLKEDVRVFKLKFESLEKSCALDGLLREIDQNAQWSYFLNGVWVKYERSINGDMELAYRKDPSAKLDITVNGESFYVDLSSTAKQSRATGQWFDLQRTSSSKEWSGMLNNHSIISKILLSRKFM